MYRIPVLSFFSGGGFLDLGFDMAGFDIVWANEVMPRYAEIYTTGISAWRISTKQEISSIPPLNLDSIATLSKSQILKEAFGGLPPSFFGVIGGPPCQDFSHSGTNQGVEGDRGQYTQSYIDLICKMQPSFFVMENVPGLYRRKHRDYFNKIVQQLETSKPGYFTTAKILSALELGVPQDRERLFLIGFRKDVIGKHFLSATSFGTIGGFNWPEPKFSDPKSMKWPQIDPFGSSNLVRSPDIPEELTIFHLVDDSAELLENGEDAFTPYSSKFKLIDEGDVSGKSFKRLHRYRYSPTVWYGNNEVHLHPWKPRRLSVREALRIQSVPDEYIMPSTISLTDKFKVISNGVPTEMARQIANSIYAYSCLTWRPS